ncbi:MAG: lysophospholipid acyltransferase family protein [Bryobacteraceae bacterium]
MKAFEFLLARVVLATLSGTPLWLARRLARFYVLLLDLAIPRLRRTALKNLEMAGFAGRERIASGVFQSIARLALTFARFPHINRDNLSDWIRYEGLENFESAKARGKGVLVATGHFGNWEFSAFAHAFLCEPMHVVVRPIDNGKIDDLVEHRRALSGNFIIRKKEAARSILRALGAGDAVGILIDQNTTPSEGVFIDFFGRKATAGTAFVKFAHHTGAAVVPGYALWSEKEGRYVLHFEREVELTGDVAADTQRVHARLEAAIRRYPDQWLWIHRRWKTQPPGDAPVY